MDGGAPDRRAKSKSGEIEKEDWKDQENGLPVPWLIVYTEGLWWDVFLRSRWQQLWAPERPGARSKEPERPTEAP